MDFSQEANRETEALPQDGLGEPPASPLDRRGDPDRSAGPAVPRLSWNRLDLAFKLLGLESALGTPSSFAAKLHGEHLRAMAPEGPGESGIAGQAEPGQPLDSLAELCRDQRAEGRGARVTLASDGSVLTGADRAACAIFLDRPVEVVRTSLPPVIHDHRFFRSRGLSDEHLDAAALRFVERAPDCFVALVWPAAQGADEEIEDILGPLVYRKEVSLDPNGAHNLLSQVYEGEPWLGDPARNYPGIEHKLVHCFARSGPLRVLVFQRTDLGEVLAAKEAVRGRFGIGKHSIHITDTHDEAVMVARLLLNDRGVHFLNAARPTRFPSTLAMARGFGDHLARKGIPADMALVDSGMVLAAYGLREAQDVDFVTPLEAEEEGTFSPHGAGAHGLPLGELLHDPRNHFHYWGLKFVSLEQVARMKRRRKSGRDLDDLRLIGRVLAARSAYPRLRAMVNQLRFVSAKGRRRAIQATKSLGLHAPLKRMQRRLRGR